MHLLRIESENLRRFRKRMGRRQAQAGLRLQIASSDSDSSPSRTYMSLAPTNRKGPSASTVDSVKRPSRQLQFPTRQTLATRCKRCREAQRFGANGQPARGPAAAV